MNEPSIFISSTMDDLVGLRREIGNFVSTLGYHDVLWEKGAVPYDPHSSAVIEASINAAKNADVVVLIVGERYGVIPTDGDSRSVTEREYDIAKEKRIPVYAFIHEAVYSTYRAEQQANINNTQWEAKSDLIRFVYRLYSDKRPGQTAIQPFASSEDIKGFLKNQWASLFGKYLREARARMSESALGESGTETDITEEAAQALEHNKLIRFLRDGSQAAGNPSPDLPSVIFCLRQSRDFRSFCREIYRKYNYELWIDRALLREAEEAYRHAKNLVGVGSDDGFDIYNLT